MGRHKQKNTQQVVSLHGDVPKWEVQHVKALVHFEMWKLPTGHAALIEQLGGPEAVLSRLAERPLKEPYARMLRCFIAHPGEDTQFYVEKNGVHYASYSRSLAKLASLLTCYLNDGTLIPVPEASRVHPVLEASEPSRPPTNLPATWTSFVGRQQELAAVRELIQRNDIRLVTLTGPGGTGKTRLSLQVATDLLPRFAHGVFFVALASLQDAELVVPRIAQTLGVSEAPGKTTLQGLQNYLRDKHILLVLDNFEHVIDAAAAIPELLSIAPQLSILVTSREVLHLYGEQLFAVPPLTLPTTDQVLRPEDVLRYDTIQLFIERSRAVQPDFTVNDAIVDSIVEICRRLDGLPLAIELVAARIRTLSLDAILSRLEKRLSFIVDGPRGLPERQQTLRAAISWSYQLLDPDEQQLFMRIGMFAGGCTVAALTGILGSIEDTSDSIESRLGALADKSLVKRVLDEEDCQRFFMLETIREYALEQLTIKKEREEIQQQYVVYYVQMAEAIAPTFQGLLQLEQLNHIEVELDNIRAVLSYCLAENQSELVLRLASALWQFWLQRGLRREGRTWISRALEGNALTDPNIQMRALFVAGNLAVNDIDYENGNKFLNQSLLLANGIGDEEMRALILRTMGKIATSTGDFNKADQMFCESLSIYQKYQDKKQIGWTLNAQGTLAWQQKNSALALQLYLQSITPLEEIGDLSGISYSYLRIGLVYFHQREYQKATSYFQEALQLFRKQKDRVNIAWLLQFLGYTHYRQGNHDSSALFAEALSMYIVLDRKPDIASCFIGLAALAAGTARPERALRLLGAAEMLLQKYPNPELPVLPDEVRVIVQDQLDQHTFETLLAEGHALPLERATSYALYDKT